MSAVVIAVVVTAAALMLVFARLTSLERRLNRLVRVDAKLDALLKHAGIRFDPYQDVPADVREALERGETILAIKPVPPGHRRGLEGSEGVRGRGPAPGKWGHSTLP